MVHSKALIGWVLLAIGTADAASSSVKATTTSSSAAASPTAAVGTFVAPTTSQVRGPCPAINILANYGYINRTGQYITKNAIISALGTVFNTGADVNTQLASMAYAPLGAVRYGVWNTSQVTASGEPYLHLNQLALSNHTDYDISLTRLDYAQGDNISPQPALFNDFYALSTDNKTLTPTQYISLRYVRWLQQKAADSKVYYDAVSEQLAWTFSALSYLTFADATGNLNIAQLRQFFIDGKIPDGWTKPATTVSLDATLAATSKFLLGYTANVPGIYTPAQAPNPAGRLTAWALSQSSYSHVPYADGLPPIADVLYSDGEYAAFLASISGWLSELSQDVALTATFLQLKGLAKFSSMQDFAYLYTFFKAPPGVTNPNVLNDNYFGRKFVTFTPHFIEKVTSTSDIPFTLANAASLISSDKIFKVDHSILAKYSSHLEAGRFMVAPTVWLQASSDGSLTPLAIRYNPGGLVVLPTDGWDWTLAKIAFNSGDTLRNGDMNHFYTTHMSFAPLMTSRLRFLATPHPVGALLDGILKLNQGNIVSGVRDGLNPYTGTFSSYSYLDGAGILAGVVDIHANYTFYQSEPQSDADRRGAGCLPDYPFLRFANAHYAANTKLMTSIVKAYYPNDAAVVADYELQAFANDAATLGQVKGFPTSITSISQLARILAYLQYLTSVRHHSQNYLSIGWASMPPSAPGAIWKAPPTVKGTVNATNLVDWLPGPQWAMGQVYLMQSFLRPLATSDNLFNIYNGNPINNTVTAAALAQFRSDLKSISSTVQAYAAADTVIPGWNLLDPLNLPNYVYI